MPWLNPYGRPDVGRPVLVSGSVERMAAETPSPSAWPSGRGSFALVGWESLVEFADVVVGSACVQVAGAVTEADVGSTDTEAAVTVSEQRASSGTVAESRTKLPNRWTASVNGPRTDDS
jgi:hypothetical protein